MREMLKKQPHRQPKNMKRNKGICEVLTLSRMNVTEKTNYKLVEISQQFR